MTNEKKIVAFHATNLDNAEEILKTGFRYKRNKAHWLGNGVYFYVDYALAEWWTTKPSKVFGTKIEVPAIIKCEIVADRNKILDLRELNNYLEFCEKYRNEFLPKVFDGTIRMAGVNIPFFSKEVEIRLNQKELKILRCAFCDYLNEQYELDLLIGTFDIPTQSYLPENYGNGFKQFSLNYIETQICVFNTEVIKNMEIISKGGITC